VLQCRRLVKGYSDTHSRGLSKFDKALAAIQLVQRRDDAADWARRLREAALKDSAGKRVAIDGLWAIAFGGDTVSNGDHNELFFTAGPNDESAGAFGTIRADNP
jgi:hypothetical protein